MKRNGYSEQELDDAVNFLVKGSFGTRSEVEIVAETDGGALIECAISKGWKPKD